MLKKLFAAAGAAVAAGALVLAAGTSAFAAPLTAPVSVTVTPNNFSGTQGQAITPLAVTVSLNTWLTDAGVAPTLSSSGLPAGVHLNSTSAPTTISGTPTVSGSGTAVITATAVESPDTNIISLNSDYFAGCKYSISGTSPQIGQGDKDDNTVDTISGVSIDPKSGAVTFTYNDNDKSGLETKQYTLPGDEFIRQFSTYTIAKTCVATADVTWAEAKAPPAPQPTPTGSTTPPPAGVPSGGVQTGGGLSHTSPLAPVGAGLLVIGLAGAGLSLRRVRRNAQH
jgi:hypothetical protein